jgi:5'(3')-deoxyribonucleotidase
VTKIDKIVLDLDCVLADFVHGCCQEWGLDTEKVYASWTPGVYPMNEALTRALGWSADAQMTDEQFWARLNGKAEFWAELPRLPWMHELLELCYQATRNVHIVTSPSYCPTSYAGKVTWIKREFGHKFTRFAVYPHKEEFARPGVVLVDDHEGNCEKFRAAGGQAILFPAHHNCLHSLKRNPLFYVRQCFNQPQGASRAS